MTHAPENTSGAFAAALPVESAMRQFMMDLVFGTGMDMLWRGPNKVPLWRHGGRRRKRMLRAMGPRLKSPVKVDRVIIDEVAERSGGGSWLRW